METPMLHDKFIMLILICLSLIGCGGQGSPARDAAPTPTPVAAVPDVGEAIKRMASQGGCRDFSAEIRMVSAGEKRGQDQIEFRIQRKYSEDKASTFVTVLSPKEEMDKAFLAIERPDQPTQAFFYLPGLKKLTRLNSGKQLRLRDTSVTVQELLGMELDHYTHGPGERVTDDGQPLIKVEFKEKPDLGLAFPRIVGFFQEDQEQRPSRFELHGSRGELLKIVRIGEIRQIKNYPTITRLSIEDIEQRVQINLEIRKVDYDRGLPDSLFTEAYLKEFVNLASHAADQTR
jgi:hypothetical protein